MTEQPLQLLINETQERCERQANEALSSCLKAPTNYKIMNLKYRTNTKEPFHISNDTNHWNTPA